MTRASASALPTRLNTLRRLADDLSRELLRAARGRPTATQAMADEISRLAGEAMDLLSKRRR